MAIGQSWENFRKQLKKFREHVENNPDKYEKLKTFGDMVKIRAKYITKVARKRGIGKMVKKFIDEGGCGDGEIVTALLFTDKGSFYCIVPDFDSPKELSLWIGDNKNSKSVKKFRKMIGKAFVSKEEWKSDNT